MTMRIGRVIRAHRVMTEASITERADDIGISANVLARVEKGGSCSDEALARILAWLLGDDAGDNEEAEKAGGE
jgi:ribosome-binding protein aMBF1 (putative translation factor)